jgi:serine/threonine protein kinase
VGSALRHIHLHQVIHRDVKPENIMFTSRGIPKLIDFGIAHLSLPSSKICVCQSKSGTVQYMSPEAMVPRTHCHGYETDFWSLGVVMYELLYLTRPYETRAPSQLVEYSGETYEATWKCLLAESESASEIGTKEADLVTSSTATDSPTHRSPSFHPIVEEDDDSPLPLSLRIPLPEISSPLNGPPSDHCTSLLSSLLDVRIHKRCGVGANFSSFSQHAFFVSRGMDVETSMLSFPSPILPDLEKIGMHLWNQFFSANLDDDVSSGHSGSPSPCPPRPEVEEYLTEIQSVTPLFYECKTDVSKHRDTKAFGTADWEFMFASS